MCLMILKRIAEIRIPELKVGGKIIQRNISINWEAGQQWCVTGASGSGKSLLLKVIAGLVFMPNSSIEFPNLKSIKEKSTNNFMISDKIAFVPQEVKIPSGFMPDLYYQRRYHATEQDDIPTVRQIMQKTKFDNGMSIEEASSLMSLSKMLDQPFVQLSNGQTRRLMISLALIKNPLILILDNPYTGLDHGARNSLNNHINILISKGVSVIIAAHEHELQSMTFVTNVLTLEENQVSSANQQMPQYYNMVSEDDLTCLIEMLNVRISYGEKQILKIDEWIVERNQKWVIRGANGSGKSTLLSLIVADHPQAYSNNIKIFGKKRGTGESVWDVKKRIGYFSSELLRYFSSQDVARDVIASGWSDLISQNVSHLSQDQMLQVEELSKWLGIEFLLEIRFGDLSFSQQKMILIARAMVRNPELLILDEPLQGMDINWRERFKNKIHEFAKNRTVLFVTHDDEEIPLGEWHFLEL